MCVCVPGRFTVCLFLVSEYIVMAPHIKAKWRTGKLAHVCNIDKTPSSISSPPYAFRQGLSLNLTVISTRLVAHEITDPDFLPWY